MLSGLKGRLRYGMRKYLHAYLFISPFYISFLIFSLFPIIFSFYLSFQEWTGFGSMKPIKLQNYLTLIKDDVFWLALKNTLFMWLGHVFIMLILALLLAVTLNSKYVRMKGFFRVVYYLPNVTATVAIALVFGLIFNTDFGILNLLLQKIGIPTIEWLGMDWSKVAIILLVLWRATGWYMVVLLAGLQSINPELYEAAIVDGAHARHLLLYITLPMLKGLLFFCFIIDTIGSFRIFTEPYILTQGGGPANSSLSIIVYLFQTGFQWMKMGYAAALGYAVFILIFLASLAQVKMWGQQTFE